MSYYNNMMILICGTSGSGKSSYAEDRLSSLPGSKKFYIATAKIYDDEMRARIERHQAMRTNKNFITIEKQTNLGSVNLYGDSSVLIESLTTWLANEMFDNDLTGASERIQNDFHILKAKCKNIILVADDVFSDGIIYDETTEFYIKTLAELLIKFASEADEVIECFAGLTWCYNHKYFC